MKIKHKALYTYTGFTKNVFWNDLVKRAHIWTEPWFKRQMNNSPLSLLTCVQGKDERDTREETAEERLRRRAYERGCHRLKKRIEGMSLTLTQHQICSPIYQCNTEPVCLCVVVEELQVEILRLMLNNKDKGTVRWCMFSTRLVVCENKISKCLVTASLKRLYPK